ncbi:MAG: creatininase family protein [Thermodesulfovibrionales bacterium]|nr:creatininase family protein [Thermodesulfovibrionales bacterium]
MILLEKITMVEFQNYLLQTKTIIFPFGTIEEHGKHLPLYTDSLIIQEVLYQVAKKKKFFLAPIIPYGVCTTTKEHLGTISIRPETLRQLSYDLVTESYKKGLRNIFLISGHGGGLHMSALKETAEQIIDKFEDIKIAVFSPYDILSKELSSIVQTTNDSHAGELETSIVLFLTPELVKGRSEEEYPKIPKPFIVKDKVKYWPGGVWGDPTKASEKKGELAIKLISDKIISLIDEMEKTSF